MEFTGSFAEIRPNHFHSGLDLRIGSKNGEPVYAPADGYVSRVNILSWGGGKMLYITHPNGYRTVYMHLDAYAGAIAQWVYDYQCSHKLYSFDAAPADTLRVQKGQVIAYAGSSGSSGGPHLHYEIRYAANDQPINPLFFGLPYEDSIVPVIRGIKIYPAQEGGTADGHSQSADVALTGKSDTVAVCGRFYTGIYATDISKGSPGKNGVERIELLIDDSLYHRYCVPTFLYEESRAVNAIIDYPEYQRTRRSYILTRQLRGNRNHFCQATDGIGIVQFADGTKHKLEYVVRDYKGNTSRRTFYVRSLPSPQDQPLDNAVAGIDRGGTPVCYFKRNVLSQPGFTAELEEGTLYDNDILLYSTTPGKGLLSGKHTLQLQRHPLPPHKNIRLRMPLPQLSDTSLLSRLLIVSVSGNRFSALTTRRQDGELTAASRTFGSFGIALDTVRPGLSAVNFKNGSRFSGKQLTVKIWDNLSGIASYHCYINGTWVLSEYDGKTACLYIDPGQNLTAGKNDLLFILTDAVGNQRETRFTLYK